MKKLFFTLFLAALFIGITRIRTDGFSPTAIEGPLTEQITPFSAEAKAALSQPYRYLGKGRQCFVFASEDQKYVVKFFNQRYLQVPWYAFLSSQERAKRAQRQHFYEHSYEIAFRELGEEILYLHMGRADLPLPSLSLRDKANRTHHLDLNTFPFVLQKKGTPFYEGLEAVYAKEGLTGLCREIDAFAGAISLRIAKHIADADQDIEHNWGYIDGRIFHLDPGRLYYDPQLKEPERLSQEWRSATHKFHRWLQKTHPDAIPHLEAICTTKKFTE